MATARFSIHSGVLLSADESFLLFADLRDAASYSWRALFSGKKCLYLHEDTRLAVERSIMLVEQLISKMSFEEETSCLWFVTRVGRLKVRCIGGTVITPHTSGAICTCKKARLTSCYGM